MRPSLPLPETTTAAETSKVAEQFCHLTSVWQASKSRLTPTGAPYEQIFTSYDPQPRFTFEVAPPDASFTERVATALTRLSNPEPTIIDRLGMLAENAAEQQVAVWLGARGEEMHRLKLYMGVAHASEGHAWAEEFIGSGTLISSCAHRLRMIGYEPESEQLEFYYRLNGFEHWHIPLLMRRCGKGTEARPFLHTFSALMQRSLDNYLPRTMGFSISVSMNGQVPILAFHCLATVLIGRDVTVRSRLLALAESSGWNLSAYAAYTHPLVALHPINPYHGILSIGLLPNGEIALGVGIAPINEWQSGKLIG